MTMAILTELEAVLPRLSLEYGGDAPAIVEHLLALRDRLKAMRPKPEDTKLVLLEDARAYVAAGRGRGCTCPSCGQNCKIYPRPLTSEMVGCLFQIIQWFVAENDWIEAKRLKKRGGDYAKLAYWKLIEFETAKPSGGRQAGRVKPTKLGVQFALGMVSVPARMLVYNTNVIGADNEESVTARDVKGFDYEGLFATVADAATLPW